MYVAIFTSRQDYTLELGTGIYLRPRCDYALWFWNTYELINREMEYCSDYELMIRYLDTYRRLRWEKKALRRLRI